MTLDIEQSIYFKNTWGLFQLGVKQEKICSSQNLSKNLWHSCLQTIFRTLFPNLFALQESELSAGIQNTSQVVAYITQVTGERITTQLLAMIHSCKYRQSASTFWQNAGYAPESIRLDCNTQLIMHQMDTYNHVVLLHNGWNCPLWHAKETNSLGSFPLINTREFTLWVKDDLCSGNHTWFVFQMRQWSETQKHETIFCRSFFW